MRWLAWLGRHELGLLLSVIVIVGGVWLFAAVADEVREGDTTSVDRAVLLALRNPADLKDPLGGPDIEEIARDVTALGGVAVLTLLTCVVAGYLLLAGKRRMALFVACAVAGGVLTAVLLKQLFGRPRPDVVPHIMHAASSSFPSGHSMMAAVTYLTLGALLARSQPRRRLKAFFLLVAIAVTVAVGISRVYLGVHWPTDVLAGWTAGAAWAAGCWLVARRLQRERTLEREAEASE